MRVVGDLELVRQNAVAGKFMRCNNTGGRAEWADLPSQAPAYVTSLPGSPVDGQEVYYAADAANGVIWHLRYRAAATGSYKWDVVGGSKLNSQAQPDVSTSAGAWVDLGGPSIPLPLSGDYDFEWGAMVKNNQHGDAAIYVDAIGTSWILNYKGPANSVNYPYSLATKVRKTGITAGTVAKMLYYGAGGGAIFGARFFYAKPTRVG